MADLLEKVETALQSALATVASAQGLANLTASDDATKTSPNVISFGENSGEEDPLFSGNHHVTARVTVSSQASEGTGLTIHRTRVGAIFDDLLSDALPATLSAAVSDFHCFSQGILNLGHEKDNSETEFKDSLLLDLYCCASDIS